MRNVTITNRKHINTSVFSPYGDSINDHINVYNLMKSHYKRIYHAKKAVNTSPPQINKSRNSLLTNHAHKSRKASTDRSQKSHEVSVCHRDALHNSSFLCSTGTLSATSLKDRQLLAQTSTASIVPGLTSSESEFFHYIVYDTKKSPSTYSEWMCQYPPSREMKNSPTNKRSPPSIVCTAKAVKPKEVSPSRRKHPISRSPAPRKSRVVWEKNKQDATSGEDSARSSRPASELGTTQEAKETLLPKSCHCGEKVAQSSFKVSSRDSAYNGGVSSGGESRGTSPDHINMLMESLSVSEKTPQTISMSKRVDAMYAKFVNDITEDVLRRGIYTNKGLKQLFNRHIAENEGSLNKERMMGEVEKLCQDLGVCSQAEQSIVNPPFSLDTGGRSHAVKQFVCTAQQRAPNCDCCDSREHQNQKYRWYRGNCKTCESASFRKKVALDLLSSNPNDNAHVWDDNLQDNYKVRDPKLGKLPDKFTKNVADKTSMGKSIKGAPESFRLPGEEFKKADTLMSNAIMQTDNVNKSVIITQTDCTPKSDVQTNTNPYLESQIYTSLPHKEFAEIDNKTLLEQIEKVIRTLHPQIFRNGCFCENANARGVHKSTAYVQTSQITLVDKATSMVDVAQQNRRLDNQHDYSQEPKKLMIDVGCQAVDVQSVKVVKCLKTPPGDLQSNKVVVKRSKNSLVDAECQTSIEMVNAAVNTGHSKFLLNNMKKVCVKMPFTTYKLVKTDHDLEEEVDEESSLVEVTNIPPDVDKTDETVDTVSSDNIEEYQTTGKKMPYQLLAPPQTNKFSTTKKVIYSLYNVADQTQSNTSNLALPLSSHSETKIDQDVFIDNLEMEMEVEVEVDSLDVDSVDSLLILKERLRNFSMDPTMLHTSILRDQAELKPMGSTPRRT